ncbi:GFA family protein [Marinobacterium aestuarii]|uniref:GFA family protein n=1 Tax=Marinobacterium aestuarii TaxID=1821621 RepID=UPI000A00789C|nr:GFA family protein [Marinobacterium aestuarii]
MITGSCLCGNVKYEISGKVGDIVHCHCVTCRKAHGSAFSSVAAVNEAEFKLIGSKNLKSFESSKGKKRYFCSNCGTQIYAKRDNAQYIILRLGSLDDDPMSSEKNHIWVSQKASWYSITNNLPAYLEFE